MRSFLLALCLLSTSLSRAADHTNLEENLPTQLEDAFPTPYGALEVQGFGRYESTEDSKNRYVVQPTLDYGIARNLEARITTPFLLGSASHEGSRNLQLEALYNPVQESLYVPALALSGKCELPTGVESSGLGTQLKFIGSKTLPGTAWLNRLHLNAAWDHKTDPSPQDRQDRYIIAVGWSARLGPEGLVIVDVVREQLPERGKDSNLLEFGVRYQLTPLTVLSLGAGPGLGQQSPDVRTSIAIQHTLTFPWLGPR